MGVRDSFQLDRFVIEPFLVELQHGCGIDLRCGDDAKSVVHISFQKEVGGVVGVPKVVRSLPLKFSGDDWDAAKSG